MIFLVPRLHHGKPWAGSNFLLGPWVELRFCINLAMRILFDGKLLLSNTNWSIQRIFKFSKNSAHIVHGRRPFKFARCAIVLLFELNGNPSLRVTSEFLWGGDSRQRSEFAILSTISSQERRVFSKFHDFHVPRLDHGKPWSRYNFLLSLWIELRFCIQQATYT